MKVLIIGDFHVPDRAADVPSQLKELLTGEKFDLVICPGDLTEDFMLKRLKDFGKLVAVMGNMDYVPLPKSAVCDLGPFRVGVVHGDGIYPRGDLDELSSLADEMGVDILVSGHTHGLQIAEAHTPSGRRILLLNPGSATGVWSGGVTSLIPSFMKLEIGSTSVIVRAYELVEGEVKSRLFEFRKQ
jgi:hypothetical protein